MKPELRAKIIAYNKSVIQNEEQAADMREIAQELAKLPPGQLKKVLTRRVLEILKKYGIEVT